MLDDASADRDSHDATETRLILIVEDNSTNARLTADMLRAGGYAVQVASDGNQGLQMARELQPALILTDLQMPGMDGLTLARSLRSDRSTCSIAVLAVTAHAMPEHREDAVRAGCCAFIAKPFRFRQLLAEISNALQSSRSPNNADERRLHIG